MALQEAPESKLLEPERGYAIAGFSFTPEQLFREVRLHFPNFRTRRETNPNVELFANLWPDSLDPSAAMRDLGFEAFVGLEEAVRMIVGAHRERLDARRVDCGCLG